MEVVVRTGDGVPHHNANQTWRDFVAAIVNERDPDRIADLIAKLNHDLAEFDQNHRAAVINIKNSAS